MHPFAFPHNPAASARSPGAPSIVPQGAKGRAKSATVVCPHRTSQISLIAGIALITAGLIFTGVGLLDKADHNRRVQVAVRQVEAHANLIKSLEWETRARRKVTSDSQAAFRHAENEIVRATQELAGGKDHTAQMEALRDTCSAYIENVTREIALMQAGQFEQASALEAAAVDPSFREVQRSVDLISEQQSLAAERTASISRIGLIAAAMFSTLTMLMYFRRFNIQRHRTEVALVERAVARKNEDRFRTLTENSAEVIMITNTTGEISYVSRSVHSVLGWSDDGVIGKNIFESIYAEDAALARAALGAVLALEGSSTIELRLSHADGRWLDFVCVLRNLIHDPNIEGLLFNVRDVTQDKKAQAVLDFNACHDALTKLPNRAVFMDRLHKVIERKKRHPETQAAVLFLDLDDLKAFNDSLGHDAGDT